MMNIKEYYMNEYPTDELGVELNEKANFVGLLNVLHTQSAKDDGDYLYEYIGVVDSLVRERLMMRLADILEKPYEYVYQIWLF